MGLIIQIILGSGLLITTGGWLIAIGSHNKTHEMLTGQNTSLKEDMAKLENRQEVIEQKQQSSEIVQATILTELKYIVHKLDELALNSK